MVSKTERIARLVAYRLWTLVGIASAVVLVFFAVALFHSYRAWESPVGLAEQLVRGSSAADWDLCGAITCGVGAIVFTYGAISHWRQHRSWSDA